MDDHEREYGICTTDDLSAGRTIPLYRVGPHLGGYDCAGGHDRVRGNVGDPSAPTGCNDAACVGEQRAARGEQG
jgi:hypothetical protein